MRVVHEPVAALSSEDALAADVETADTFAAKAKGMMFRDSVPEDYALVFDFGEPPRWSIDGISKLRTIHMLFVKVPLDVLWIVDGTVTKRKTVSPWTGFGMGKADVVIELPAGAADGVEEGDTVRVVEDD